ncbi:MAG: AMP-binding protein, partial [Planctomycetales bacterium]|nr:AMP-binding protein [Planctomycetales bacterium]
TEIQRQYGIKPSGVDLACFPLFGLFNVACGVTTVLPEMDFSKPASCDPQKLFKAASDWKVTQAFASPAVWDRLSRYAEQSGEKITTLRKVFSCGAPVPAEVIRRTLAMVHPAAELHTPYGATESLPVATLEAKEILGETARKTDFGAGVCVGRRFESIQWRVIRITDEPIDSIEQAEGLPPGEIGELIVRGPQVSRRYVGDGEARVTKVESPQESSLDIRHSSIHNLVAKINDGDTVWHRMGDVGYFDNQGRFWYCGRKSQRVVTAHGTLYTECVEAKVNRAENIARSALVGIGPRPNQTPVIVYESDRELVLDTDYLMRIGAFSTVAAINLEESHSESELRDAGDMGSEPPQHLSDSATSSALRHPTKLPTDIRHNSKINREKLSDWAEKKLEQQ